MPTTTAPVLILGYFKGVLSADTVLSAMTPPPSINVAPVPMGATFPRVVLEAPSSEGNLNALQQGYAVIQKRPRVQVSVWSSNENTDAIDAIAARIETLMDGQGSVTLTGGEAVDVAQVDEFYLPATEQNANRAVIIQIYSTAVRTA